MKKLYTLALGTTMLLAATTAFAFNNLTPAEAKAAVETGGAYIVDVRTDAEFIWVGHPSLGINDDKLVNISSKIEQKGAFINNPSFISDMDGIFGSAKGTHIITMCRSGQRSLEAAIALEAAGYTNVSNMLDGFEGGKKDANGNRNVNGYKNIPGHKVHTSAVGAEDYYQD